MAKVGIGNLTPDEALAAIKERLEAKYRVQVREPAWGKSKVLANLRVLPDRWFKVWISIGRSTPSIDLMVVPLPLTAWLAASGPMLASVLLILDHLIAGVIVFLAGSILWFRLFIHRRKEIEREIKSIVEEALVKATSPRVDR